MTKKILHHKIFSKGREIAIVSAVVLIISAFLTWGRTSISSVTGMSGDGKYVIGVGILALFLLFFKHIPKIIAAILSLGIISLAGYYFIYMGMFLGNHPYISLLFAIDLFIVTVLILRRIGIFASLGVGINALAIGLIDFYTMSKAAESLSGEIGYGLYVGLIASLGIVIGTIIEGCQEKDPKLRKKLLFFDQVD